MKTKSQILIDNGFSVRLASHDDLISISKAMDEYAASVQKEIVVPSENARLGLGEPHQDSLWRNGYKRYESELRRLNPDRTFIHNEK